MKFFFIVLSFTTICLKVVAQSNFKPGYIVNLTGDTTRGLIDYREWNENPQRVGFKTSAEAALQQYAPQEIAAFGADMLDQYRSYTGPITKSAVDLRDLSAGIDSSNINGSFFLRTLIIGKNLSLYNYSDKIKPRYFISEKNGAPIELKQYVYLDPRQSDKIRKYNFYIQQLLAFATKYAPQEIALAARINKAKYKSSEIRAIVVRLNNNTDNYKINDAAGGGAEFFIGVGANMANASFFGIDKSNYAESIFNTNTNVQSVGPLLASGMNFYLNKSVKKLFFKVELNLTMNKIRATYTSIYTGFNTIGREEELTFNQIGISAVPQLAYNIYNTENIKFFVAAGFQLNFSSFSNTHYYGTNTSNGQFVDKQDNQILYKKITTSLTAKTGITLANKVDIYLGYGSPVSVTDHRIYGVDLSYYRFGINYLFSKK